MCQLKTIRFLNHAMWNYTVKMYNMTLYAFLQTNATFPSKFSDKRRIWAFENVAIIKGRRLFYFSLSKCGIYWGAALIWGSCLKEEIRYWPCASSFPSNIVSSQYSRYYTILQNKRRRWLGAPPPPTTDNFWTVNFTSTNYTSLEREFNSE